MENPKTTLLSAKEWAEFVFKIHKIIEEGNLYSFLPLEDLDIKINILLNLRSDNFAFLSEPEIKKIIFTCIDMADHLELYENYKDAIIVLEHTVSLCNLCPTDYFVKKEWYYDCLSGIARIKLNGSREMANNPSAYEEGVALIHYIHQLFPDHQKMDYYM